MAFPQVLATNSGNSGATSIVWPTPHTINLPSGIEAGDILLIFFATGLTSVADPLSGWTRIDAAEGSTVRVAVWRRIATGSEGSTVNVTLGGATRGSAHVTYRISGSTTPTSSNIIVTSTNTDAAPDPPSLSSDKDIGTLWIVGYGWQDGRTTHSSYPTNYSSNQVTDRSNQIAGAGIAVATREFETSSANNPGAGAISSSQNWNAFTMYIENPVVRTFTAMTAPDPPPSFSIYSPTITPNSVPGASQAFEPLISGLPPGVTTYSKIPSIPNSYTVQEKPVTDYA